MKKINLVLVAVLGTLLAGCADRPTLTNSAKALHKLSTEFAADAALRHPFKAAAPSGGAAKAKADVDYMFQHVQLVNLSDEDWTNVEVWINRGFVVHVPKIEKGSGGGKVKTLNFNMFYDGKGRAYQSNDLKTRITQIDLYRDGKVYSVPLSLAD